MLARRREQWDQQQRSAENGFCSFSADSPRQRPLLLLLLLHTLRDATNNMDAFRHTYAQAW